ncbi:MAG: DUF3419 family protein [Alphaproteobacteria bacterium]|nr:DUF3419 family protein [Alphaproteobacteria bacterium]
MGILNQIFPSAFTYRNFDNLDFPVSEIHERLHADTAPCWIERLFPNKFAQKYYPNPKGRYIAIADTAFSRFSPSYATTNENMRVTAKILKPFGKRVLTCGGSGDQTIWFARNDAVHIDSFDISWCSKITMDLKNAAIKALNVQEYENFVRALHKDSACISETEEYKHIEPLLSRKARRFMRAMKGKRFSGNGVINDECFLNKEEFLHMKSKTPTGKFIWSDLGGLNKKISGKKYDIIYLSNIFQYLSDPEKIAEILERLVTKHLCHEGAIAVEVNWIIDNKKYAVAANKLKELGNFYETGKLNEKMLVFCKTK